MLNVSLDRRQTDFFLNDSLLGGAPTGAGGAGAGSGRYESDGAAMAAKFLDSTFEPRVAAVQPSSVHRLASAGRMA